VTPGQALQALASFRTAVTARTCQVGIAFYTSTGTYISQSLGVGVADSTTGWVHATATATAPALAAFASAVVNIASTATSEIHYVDCVGIFPATESTWSTGGFVGLTTATILRSDGVYVRGASPANPLAIPAAGQAVTVEDFEVAPGVTYTYQAQAFSGAGSSMLASALSAATGNVSVTSDDWWILDPTATSTALLTHVLSLTTTQMRQAAAHFTLGQEFTTVISDVTNGRDGAIQFECFSATEAAALLALINEGTVLLLTNPFGESYYAQFGPAPGGMSSGMGLKLHDTALLTSTPAMPHRTITTTWNEQARPAV
jgi:hypothetical protein